MDLREFHNALRILRSIDAYELRDAGVENTDREWPQFGFNPWEWFIRASDHDAAAVWTIIERRQPRGANAPAEAAE